MRDILVATLVLLGLIYTIRRPHIGVLLWSWLGYMNPHRLCWGFAYSFPFSYITAITTSLSYLFSKESKKLPKDKLLFLLFLFIVWMTISTILAIRPEGALEEYIRIIKIQFGIVITLLMFNSRERINQLILVIVASIGFYGFKGGIFTVLTGGGYHVFGPPSSFIEENNALAVATLMIMPLLVYYRSQLTKNWQRQFALFALICMAFSVLGSQSRGALLAISTVGLYFWTQSRQKWLSAILIASFAVIVFQFLPESWHSRMETIQNYQQDSSAMARIHAWQLAYNVATDHFFGGGLRLWSKQVYMHYFTWFDPLKMQAFVAHSIYFSVLGEQGWGGLLIYLLIHFTCWRYCSKIIQQCKDSSETKWMSDLAKMIKVSLLAYYSGGAFLSIAYFDLPWHLISIVVLLRQIMLNHKPSTQNEENQPPPLTSNNPNIEISPTGYIR